MTDKPTAKKAAKPAAKKLPAYMKRMSSDGTSTSAVSARVDNALKDRFTGAVELARQHNIELSISEVIRDAMERACNDIEKYTGKLIGQIEMPLDDVQPQEPK